MHSRARSASWLAISVFSILSATSALAQDGSGSSEEASQGDEIVVTARRRDENIQDVPVAVSAFSEKFLEDRGIRDSADISRAVPSLYIDQGGFSSSSTNIAMRGITNPGSNISFDPTIGIYVDEVYLARNYGTLFDYFDVSSIQVLRGVQGTMFGRNNLGGAILIGTAKPEDANYAKAEIGYGNYDAKKAGVVVNVSPAPGVLHLRAGFVAHKRDGWGLDVNSGSRLSSKNTYTARASALLTPGASSEFQLTYERSWRDQSGPIFSPRQPTGRTVRPGLGFYEVAYDSPVGDEGTDQYLTGRGKVDLGGVEAKLIANWLKGDETVEQDVDATDSGTNVHFIRRTLHEQKSAEFQLSGNGIDSRLQWVAGLYYLDETGEQPTTNVGFNTQTRLFIENKTKAAFVHADFNLTDALQLGGGIRYTKDDKEVAYGTLNLTTGACTTAAAVRVPGLYNATNCLVTVGLNSGYWSWDANINYAFSDDVRLYARAGRGQKSGGFNSGLANAADLLGYRPEVATDYEIGLKTTLLDRRIRLNLAAYQTDYKDVQRTRLVLVGTVPNQSTVLSVSNAAKARIRGFEAEFSARPADGLSLNANYSYTDPKYLNFTSLDTAGNVVDQSHFPFAYVSKHQIGADVNYEFEAGSAGTLDMNINYSHRSTYVATVVPDPLFVQPGYGLWGGKFRFQPAALPGMELIAWATNLTNEKWMTHGASSGSIRFAGPGTPRLYGVTLKYRFGD